MRKHTFLALGLTAVIAAGSVLSVAADTLEDLEQEQQYYEQQQQNTEQQLADINSEIDSLQTQKQALLADIDNTDAQLVLTLASIDTLNGQITEKTAQLEQTSADLDVAEENEAVEYNAMKKRIQYLYENGGNGGWATILLEEKDITDMLNQAEYTQKMYDYDRECLTLYADTVAQVTALKDQQTQEKTDLELMKANQEEQQAHLEEMLAEMRVQNENYDSEINYANDIASEYSRLLNEQNAKIQELMAAQEAERQRIAEEEAARKAAEEAARKAAEEAARQEAENAAHAGGGSGYYTEPA